MMDKFIKWLYGDREKLPDVTGCTLMQAAEKMEGYPFHPAAYVLIKAMCVVIERHETEIKELKDKMNK